MAATRPMAKAKEGEPVSIVTAAHSPRALHFIRREEIAGWRVKAYGIAANGRLARKELVSATSELALKVLPRLAVDAQHHGIGFTIAHDAAAVCFGLIYWWQSQNELHQRIFISPQDRPAEFSPIANPAAGCVWELGIIDFERRAWLADVLANPRGPDIELYLSRELNTML